jgi:hypothetical protein
MVSGAVSSTDGLTDEAHVSVTYAVVLSGEKAIPVTVPRLLLDDMGHLEKRHGLWISEEDVTAFGLYFNIIARIVLSAEERVETD